MQLVAGDTELARGQKTMTNRCYKRTTRGRGEGETAL